jgi:glutathione S-transferase
VGECLSLADIAAATVLRTAYSFYFGKAERAKYPHTFRFYETIISDPSIKGVLSGGQLAETAQQYVPPPVTAPTEKQSMAESSKLEKEQ